MWRRSRPGRSVLTSTYSRLLLTSLSAAFFLIFLATLLFPGRPVGERIFSAAFTALTGAAVWVSARQRVELTEEGLVHRVVRARRIAWEEVAGIDIGVVGGEVPGVEPVAPSVLLADGTRRDLTALMGLRLFGHTSRAVIANTERVRSAAEASARRPELPQSPS